MHGAAVHFPIALVVCSGALDALAFLAPGLDSRLGLRSASYWMIVLGAAGTVPAVLSGLFMSRGVLLGHDALRMHHLFVWPSFALVVGLATWRVTGRAQSGHGIRPGYLALLMLALGLLMAAGYWGGELILKA